MTLDRTGEALEPEPLHDPRCHRGWLGYDEERRPIPCLICRPHLTKTTVTNDFSARIPSFRAQSAIDREEYDDRNR